MELEALIDSAANGRPRARVAAEIPIAYQALHDYEKGRKPCPAWVVARLAEIAGTDPQVAALQALKDSAKTPAESELWGRLLRGVTGGALAVTLAVAGLLTSKPAYSIPGVEQPGIYIVHCL